MAQGSHVPPGAIVRNWEELPLSVRTPLVVKRWEFQSTVQQIYRWKEEDFRVVKIEAELILEANRLQLMKQDLGEGGECLLDAVSLRRSRRRYLVLRLQLMEIQMARMITKRKVVRGI
ncbi:hypothetical protein TNCV_1697651 [Trichonephila clavipes]|nr:hypothetical protein TNCV_1697651 [Trichonephila clavipes]